MTEKNKDDNNSHSAAEIFWQAANEGRLLLPRCKESGKCFFYPREYSPFTGGDIEWLSASGKGEVYSCSVNFRADPLYCIAYIRLQEGPVIMSNILAENPEALKTIGPGDKVEVVFKENEEGQAIPYFVPA